MAGTVRLCLFLILSSICLVNSFMPSSDYHSYDWSEAHAFDFGTTAKRSLTGDQASLRVNATRAVLAERGVHAYIVPTSDAHTSQYIAPSDARREWLSGLSGSSGTAVVTATHALLWTDARYFTQFEIQVNTTVWTLMRQGTDLTIDQWLAANMAANSVVGVDPTTYTRSMWTPLENTLRSANVWLQPIAENLVDLARTRLGDPPPPRPNQPLITFGVEFHGRVSRSKITDLQSQITARGASALVLTALDDIAYTLNLRGSDIPFNPVFFSYLVIRTDVAAPNNVVLFWGDGTLPLNVSVHLLAEGIIINVQPYTQIFDYLRNMSVEFSGRTIWLSQDASHAIHLAAEAGENTKTLSTLSPVQLMKCVKNEVELRGFRNSHIKDGIAVVRLLRWVHQQVDAGANVTEIEISDRMLQMRQEEEHFIGPSFATIAGAGENGAIIHYRPSREGPQRVLGRNDMLLLDSGGQYRDGTTDITRTRHMGTLTDKQRLTFTRVLKGQIAIRTAVFPRGTGGHVLDVLARKPLWEVGLNYAHGTGHGLGHFLNVHEGPSGILASPMPNEPGIVPGMIFSNEPGYYEVGEYGIRHEDIVEVIEITNITDHIKAADIQGNFDGRGALAFRDLSLAPHQTSSLDISLLTDFEIKFLNAYHARVLATLGPILRRRNFNEDLAWLEKECAPISSGAILLTAAPFLTVIGIFSLWFNV